MRRRPRSNRTPERPQHWNDCCYCNPYRDWYDDDRYYTSYDDYRPYGGYEYAAPPPKSSRKPKASNVDGMDNGWYCYSEEEVSMAYKQGFQDGWKACYTMSDSESEVDKPMPKPVPKIEDIVE